MGIIYKNGIPYGNQPSTDAVAMIEPSEEASATSAHAYAVGEHFIYNDTLYRATAAIAIGDTITPDTNCVATNVMTEVESGGGGGGTSDYTQLSNKPQINGVTLTGNKSLSDIGAASQSDLEDLEDITGDGQLSGFTATDLTGAANELRNTLNQLDQNMAYVETGNTASRTYATGDFISWKGVLYKANQAIPATTAFSTGSGGNLDLVAGNGGGLNALNSTNAFIGNPIFSPGIDLSTVGVKYFDWEELGSPVQVSGFSFDMWLLYGNSYRFAPIGYGGTRVTYYVNTTYSVNGNIWAYPLYKRI